MDHVYLFTLEIVPLEVGRVYDDLPSHLTLMSRFSSDLSPETLSSIVRPLFTEAKPVKLLFGKTIVLGPKKVVAHMIDSADEQLLHEKLRILLAQSDVTFQYPHFIGSNHKAHVTQREGIDFPPKSQQLAVAAYLIEVIDAKRVVRSRLALGR